MDLKEQGIPLVGTYCTFMPQEIPMAAGVVVVSLCSTSDETIEEAEKIYRATSAADRKAATVSAKPTNALFLLFPTW